MGKVKPTKVPPRRVSGDTYVVMVDGQECRPHAGEWVEFRRRMRVESLLLDLRLNAVRVGNTAEAEEVLIQMLGELADAIVAWSWTDEDGNPYPSPPDAATLRRLPAEEVWWLREVYLGRLQPETEGERLNG